MSGQPQGAPREAALTDALVRLADTLVDDFDVIDLMVELTADCVALFAVDTAGLLLADGRYRPRVVAASTEETRLVELFELQADEGPCLECLRSSRRVSEPDLVEATARWPGFAPRALDAGFRAVHAIPMRLRRQTIGALNLFTASPGDLPAADVLAAQALADVATISVLQNQASVSRRDVTAQLQLALDSRIVIEQAKGVLAERGGLDMTTAFDRLRKYARHHRLRLSGLAEDIAARRVSQKTMAEILGGTTAGRL
ncbi:GAF and ANTAR domain-containing protein [Actinomycetospora straminea]|uniref:GAF and ANTAR domain-containing protein n=1 Tax=Actinomycetospora straminea TaxID=663607 RepID=A0ABP9EPZ6_9PSEU|nr:GAF and ANTAR domain-containing protein [Actinomycetospora straminea]MDD7935469.1 GAF and ANTAR domain-containing protein [Actinomycetospora straminea]